MKKRQQKEQREAKRKRKMTESESLKILKKGMRIGDGTVAPFITEDFLDIQKVFKRKMNQVGGFYVGQKYDGGEVFRAFGTNLTFIEDGIAVLIPGDEIDIREARRGMEGLIGTKLTRVYDNQIK
jgi:hypothetical protein